MQRTLAEAYRFLDGNSAYQFGGVSRAPGLLRVAFAHGSRPAESFTLFVRENGVAHASVPDSGFLGAGRSARSLLLRLHRRIRADGGLHAEKTPSREGERGKSC